MASIIFSDYHLIQGFYEKCEADISAYKCGTIDQGKGENHQQGKVINCLQRHADELNSDCKHQILRIAEFSADDYHQDRALFFACRNDRERFCEKLTSGNGKVYKCLMKHKFEHDMSEA
ncbi:Golgi apparatus protein 1-like, partial [Saccoglossus kowalevskii]